MTIDVGTFSLFFEDASLFHDFDCTHANELNRFEVQREVPELPSPSPILPESFLVDDGVEATFKNDIRFTAHPDDASPYDSSVLSSPSSKSLTTHLSSGDEDISEIGESLLSLMNAFLESCSPFSSNVPSPISLPPPAHELPVSSHHTLSMLPGNGDGDCSSCGDILAAARLSRALNESPKSLGQIFHFDKDLNSVSDNGTTILPSSSDVPISSESPFLSIQAANTAPSPSPSPIEANSTTSPSPSKSKSTRTKSRSHVKQQSSKDASNRTCTLCSKVFYSKFSLVRHMRVHENQRPFSCSVCSRAFRSSGNLKQHMRTHSGERPFKCPSCPARFGQSSTLKYHQRVHLDERPFVCGVAGCSKSFRSLSNKLRHQRNLHAGESLSSK